MARTNVYNYDNFCFKHYDFSKFESLPIGSTVPDINLMNLDGEPVSLRNNDGKRIVIETGCITCPMFMANVKQMNELAKKFKDTTFYILYTREAHPGEHIPAHNSIEAKLLNSRRLKKILADERNLIVDGVEGDLHKQLGALPNSAFIFSVQGVLKYRANWCHPDKIHTFLSGLTENTHTQGLLAPKIPPITSAFRVILAAGHTALWNIMRSFPELISARKFFKTQIT
jgi:hypothetical protein